jgi:hypothetical protein
MRRATQWGGPSIVSRSARLDHIRLVSDEPIIRTASGAKRFEEAGDTLDVPAERHGTMRHSTTSFHVVELVRIWGPSFD